MATHDLSGGAVDFEWNSVGVKVKQNVIDFSDSNYTFSSGDVIQVCKQPKYTKAMKASIRVLTAEGGTLTYDLGYTGGTVDVLVDGANGNSAAGTIEDTVSTGETENASSIVTANDTIDLLLNNAADTGKICVTVFFEDHRIPEQDFASPDVS